MGTIKATNIEPIADNGTITLGSSGDTFSLGSGVNSQLLRPSFQAYLGSSQSIGVNTNTTVAIDTEEFDTDSAFNVSNYRFTVPSGKAGKYLFYGSITMANFFAYAVCSIFKNGSEIRRGNAVRADSSGVGCVALVDLAVGDYVTLNAYQDQSSQALQQNSNFTYFGGYRIGT
jgi:hypothetical protein|tara:strand:+ start:415 stop:933 length:519 start_codon:yes stop_codon:yes gene_type:complete